MSAAAAGAVVERAVVEIGGPEAAEFLQGQISQDVTAIEVGGWARSLLLSPSGHLVAWFRLHRLDESRFLADLDHRHLDQFVERLTRFRLRTEVTIEPLAGWVMASVRGDGASRPSGQVVVEVAWPGLAGFDALGRDAALPDMVTHDPDALEAARIAAGMPAMGAELHSETIPAEAGDAFIEQSVSFSKGCYTGQELVARIDSRGGNVPRPVRRLRFTDASAAAIDRGEPVEFDGSEVGSVTSAAPGVALAVVARKVAPGDTVAVAGAAATVESLP